MRKMVPWNLSLTLLFDFCTWTTIVDGSNCYGSWSNTVNTRKKAWHSLACSRPCIAASPLVNSSETIVVNCRETKPRLIAALLAVPPPTECSYSNASADRRLMYKVSLVNSEVTELNLTKFIHDARQFVALLTRPERSVILIHSESDCNK